MPDEPGKLCEGETSKCTIATDPGKEYGSSL
jgi:hypothetical protein